MQHENNPSMRMRVCKTQTAPRPPRLSTLTFRTPRFRLKDALPPFRLPAPPDPGFTFFAFFLRPPFTFSCLAFPFAFARRAPRVREAGNLPRLARASA